MPERTTEDHAIDAPARIFERLVRDAMDRADLSLSALARLSGVDRGRWYTWFRGENTPQSRSLRRAADALGIEVSELTAPWGESVVVDREGSLVEALRAQTTALSELVALLRPLVGDHAESIETRLRTLEALAMPRSRSGGGGSPKRSSPRATAG